MKIKSCQCKLVTGLKIPNSAEKIIKNKFQEIPRGCVSKPKITNKAPQLMKRRKYPYSEIGSIIAELFDIKYCF